MPKLSRVTILIFIGFSFIFMSCNQENEKSDEINISVTLPPFADFTKQIVGNRANVYTLIPPGINAHSFEPTPTSIKSILESNIYFKVGDIFHFEEVLFEKVETNELTKVLDCSAEIKIVNNDPHYWLSPPNVKIITQNILNVMVESYPQHKNYFTNNTNRFIHKIDSLDAEINQILEDKKQRTILVFHPAWKYLANHYQLEEIAIEQNGKAPRAKDLEAFIRIAKEKGAKCIFFDPHFDNTSVSTVAKSLGLKIDSLDPLPDNYLQNLTSIGNKLDKYLE